VEGTRVIVFGWRGLNVIYDGVWEEYLRRTIFKQCVVSTVIVCCQGNLFPFFLFFSSFLFLVTLVYLFVRISILVTMKCIKGKTEINNKQHRSCQLITSGRVPRIPK
jgi:hypothetical protein